MKNKFDIVISGYYGFKNIGDDAVLRVLTEKLSELVPSVKIAVITGNCKESSVKNGVVYLPRRNIPLIIRSMRSAVLISGGGSLLQNVTSCRSLLYYTSVLLCGKLFCKKVISYANGIGPVKPMGKALMKLALSFSDTVTVRDPDSYETAISLGSSREKTSVSADPVFLAGCAPEAEAVKALRRCGVGEKRFFAVSLRTPVKGSTLPLGEIVKFCNIQRKKGLIPLFFPMQETYDGDICRRTAKMCYGYVLPAADAGVLLAVLKKAEFSVGMRLHFLLLSAMAALPCVSLSYDRKIDSEMPYVGENHVLPCSCVTAKSIICALEKAKKDTSAEMLRERCLNMRVRAMHDIGMIAAALYGESATAKSASGICSVLKIGIKSAGND